METDTQQGITRGQRRFGRALVAVAALGASLALALPPALTHASGGRPSGGGGSGGSGGSGGGSSAALCGQVTLNAVPASGFSYYLAFRGTATNCGSSATTYTVDIVDVSTHADPACTVVSPTSGRPATLPPGTVAYSLFAAPFPCYDTYTFEARLSENHTVVATASVSFTTTPNGIVAL